MNTEMMYDGKLLAAALNVHFKTSRLQVISGALLENMVGALVQNNHVGYKQERQLYSARAVNNIQNARHTD